MSAEHDEKTCPQEPVHPLHKQHPGEHQWTDAPKSEEGAVWCVYCRFFLRKYTGLTNAAGVPGGPAWEVVRAPLLSRPGEDDRCEHGTVRPTTARWCKLCGYLEAPIATNAPCR
jgi:hypothetical protein